MTYSLRYSCNAAVHFTGIRIKKNRSSQFIFSRHSRVATNNHFPESLLVRTEFDLSAFWKEVHSPL
jgi:hypothetical protein